MNKSKLDPEASPSAEFGAFLRSAREERGWKQHEVARMIGCSHTHISHLENGHRRATPHLARKLDKAFGTGKAFTNKARDTDSAALLEGFAAYVAEESTATELRLFTLGIIPGVLQTLDYAREIAAGAVRRGHITPDVADRRVAVLARRQAKLRRESPPAIHVVLDESCIQRPVGSPRVMADQLDALVEFAALPHTMLQIAPLTLGADRAFDLPIYILTRKDRSLMCYAESSRQGNLERDSGAVTRILGSYYQLQAMALSQPDTVVAIRDRRKDLP
ncbi:Scr1 family TA system antitoxin-like transcriptional regulator [Kitasatospora sp. NPDC094011]|uniref:helix-turn-helix domain-containing protein n=1 Tax=Kitasatospora sp. NPDC094011 TaxID=3364090 RepID=UPI00382058EF